MINNKKKINKIKTQKFLNEFSIKFLLQHNNFTVKDWFDLRQKIQEIGEDSVEIFTIKNSLLKKSLFSLNNPQEFHFLCQGPNFLIGCKNENHFKSVWSFINSHSKLNFISCFYGNQLINHLDLEVLLKTDFSIYSSLVDTLTKETELYNVLQHQLKMHPLVAVQSHSLTVLEYVKQSKKKINLVP
uniref:50S ribosomal protein L10 n=1 Tax=Micractinium sp. LBA 32 TaxID=1759591 RepID=A0A411IKN8_9CHLO|nr:hypothetical protein [Micractinium sp. LBA 32]